MRTRAWIVRCTESRWHHSDIDTFLYEESLGACEQGATQGDVIATGLKRLMCQSLRRTAYKEEDSRCRISAGL